MDGLGVVLKTESSPHFLTLFLGETNTVTDTEVSFKYYPACVWSGPRIPLVQASRRLDSFELDGLGKYNFFLGVV